MNELPQLPLPDAPPDEASEGHVIEFRFHSMGIVAALVFNEDGMKEDELRGHSMREVYDTVRSLYPQARWDGMKEEKDAEAE